MTTSLSVSSAAVAGKKPKEDRYITSRAVAAKHRRRQAYTGTSGTSCITSGSSLKPVRKKSRAVQTYQDERYEALQQGPGRICDIRYFPGTYSFRENFHMRQRKPKDLEKRLETYSEQMITAPAPERVQEYFHAGRPLMLEIGCGKGQFIRKKALDNPDKDYIAIEGQDTVILRALEKAAEAAEENYGAGVMPNLRFIMAYVDHMSDFFREGSIDGIYLNFSDPWPKARHAKRRLTYRERLMDYCRALKPGGFIEIKTDNDGLYDFTLEEIDACGLHITEQTRDLHSSGFASRYTTTEYEDRFRGTGKNINYVRIEPQSL